MKKVFFIICLFLISSLLVSCKKTNELPNLETPFKSYKFRSGEAMYDLKNNQVVFIDGIKIYIYRPFDMKPIKTIEVKSDKTRDSIHGFDVSDGKIAISLSEDKKIKIYNLSNGNLLRTIKTEEDSYVNDLKFKESKLFFSEQGYIYSSKWNSIFGNKKYLDDTNDGFILGPKDTILITDRSYIYLYDYELDEIVYQDSTQTAEYYSPDAFFDGTYYHYRGMLYDLDEFKVHSTNNLAMNYPEIPGYILVETVYH